MIPSLLSSTGDIVKTGQSSLIVRDPTALSGFSAGEEVTISIRQRLSDHRYLIALKGRMIQADSQIPLKKGEKLLVRIDGQHPQLILRVLTNPSLKDIFSENLRFFRANREGVLINLTEVEEMLRQAVLSARLSSPIQNHIRTIMQLIQSLRYSPSYLDNREYLRDYLTGLGLFGEGDVKKVLIAKGERGVRDTRIPGNLKGLLMQLTEKMKDLLDDKTLSDLNNGVKKLQTAAEKAVKTIENQQVLNVMLQETDHASLLQIPLVIPGGVKLGEIFIQTDDRTGDPSEGQRSFTVNLFFDLDMLGRVFVELRSRSKKIDCLCKCEGEDVREFISSQLPVLQDTLSAAGYRVERLTCIREQDLENQRLAFLSNYQLYTTESINIFA